MKKVTIVAIFFGLLFVMHFINVKVNSERIQAGILEESKNSLQINGFSKKLKVLVDGRDVVVTGTVEGSDEKQRVFDTLSTVKGIRVIKNLVKVVPTQSKIIEKTKVVEKVVETPKLIKSKTVEVEKKTEEKFKVERFRIFFEHNSVLPSRKGQETLDLVTKLFKNKSVVNIEIHGHANYLGQNFYNQNLSRKRAEGVQYILSSKGLDIMNSRIFGHGEKIPIQDMNQIDKNRRVDLYVKIRE